MSAGNSSIRVSWSAPAANGVAIIGYQATANPGPASCATDGVTSCVIGAEAGTSYTVTVVALSASGTSPASAASDSVTPTAPAVATEPPVTDLPLDTGEGAISTAAPGQALVMIGNGYAPYSTVTITIYSSPIVLATITADADGAFAESVTVPDSVPTGSHSFVAAGVDSDGNFRALRLDVTIAPTSAGDNLPVTGPDLFWLIAAGFIATMLGIALRSVGHHRPRHRR